jgi:hypothetical protein
VDVKPDSDTNPIQPFSQGVVPVAILGADDFDVTTIDRATLALAPGPVAPAHSQGGHEEDVNGDGFPDLVSHYRIPEIAFRDDTTELCVSGFTADGSEIEGCDTIQLVGGCGLGPELAGLLPALLWRRARRSRRRPLGG